MGSPLWLGPFDDPELMLSFYGLEGYVSEIVPDDFEPRFIGSRAWPVVMP
jgi:hypothetical protein